MDQLNALDGEDEAETKTQVRRWLNRCRYDMKTVVSISADNITFHKTRNFDHLFTVNGGFTKVR